MKKSLSLILALAMVFTMFASVAFAADDTTTAAPTTVTATTYTPQQAFDALKAAGIVEGDAVKGANLDANMTRAEFAKVIAKLWMLTEDPAGSTVYTDLVGASWAAGYIGAATKVGLLNGVGGGKFNPSGNVKLEEIAKVIATGFKLTSTPYAGTGKVDSWANGYVGAVIAAKLVDDSTDFSKPAKRSELFTIGIKAYAAYQASLKPTPTPTPTPSALVLSAVASSTNTSVKVTLTNAVTTVDKSQFTIQSFAKVDLAVSAATLSADGKVVILTTAAQTPYGAYTLTAGGTSKTFVGLPVDTTKATFTGATDTYVSYIVTFSEEVSAASATNIKNYVIDNGLTVTKADLDATGKIVTLTTIPQTVGVVYGLTVSNVADLSGNVSDSATIYFGGQAKDTSNLTVTSLSVSDYNKVVVVFSKKVDAATATNVNNYVIDNSLTVLKAEVDTVDTTGKTVNLTTSDQTVGTVYKIVFSNITDTLSNGLDTVTNTKYFGGVGKDLSKPLVTVNVTDNNKVTATFDKAVDSATATNVANYTVDNSLTVTKAELDSTGKIVTLTTSSQTVGIVYGITIANVKSALGTTMDGVTKYFGGIAKDVTAPGILTATVSAANTVTIQFDENVTADSIATLTNYSFDGGLGYPIAAEIVALDTSGRTVKLTTGPQTAAKVYNVSVTGVTDTNGNVITTPVVKSLVGQSTAAASVVKFLAATVVDQNTIDLVFDSAISAADALTVGVTIPSVTTSAYYSTLQTNTKVVRVQFRTVASANPSLFIQGQIYSAQVTGGVTNLETPVLATNNNNIKSFAGTSVANALPEVKAVVPVNSTAVKVIFTEPVTGLLPASFKINTVIPSSISVSSTVYVTEAILYYATPTLAGTINNLELQTGAFTDTSGQNGGVVLAADGSKLVKTFGGTSVTNSAPTIVTAVAIDKYNFKIIFNEEVVKAEAEAAAFTITGGTITQLDSTLGDDNKTLTIVLSSATPIVQGTVYTVSTISTVHDLQGTAMLVGSTDTGHSAQLGGTSVANAQPTIAAVSVDSTKKIITVTLSEMITNTILTTDNFVVTATGYTAGAITISDDGLTVTINSSTPLTASQIAKVHATALDLDINGQTAITDDVQFGVQ